MVLWPCKITMVYTLQLARHEVGCEPDLLAIFLQSPIAWFNLVFGPFCATMFRFRGPHATPDLALSVYHQRPALVLPREFPLQELLELMLGYFLCRFWSSLPHISAIKQSSPLMRRWMTPFIDLNN